MTRLLGVLSVLAFLPAIVLAPAASAQPPPPSAVAPRESWAGDWHGALTLPTGRLRLVLTIREGADGALAGEVESPDQAPGQKIPVAAIAIANGRMTFSIAAIGATYEGSWQPRLQRFAGTFTQGAALPLDLARGAGAADPVVAGLDGRWEGKVNRNGVDLRLILRIVTGPRGTIALLDSPDLMAMGLAVTGLTRDGRTVSFAVPAGASGFRGTLDEGGGRLSGIWSRTGSPDTAILFTRSAAGGAPAARARPQLPRPPFPYRSEEVRFANPRAPGVTLAGTLTLPPGSGPFAAAILISGSGGQDRDESVWTHKPFAVLADHLTRQGIAVLRYDDRGIGASTGTYPGATSADFATDADAAFAFLSARPEIDRRAIGFVGHSEGGLIGPLAAADNDEIAYLVLMAGPGTASPALMRAQHRAVGQSQGMNEAELDRMAPINAELFAIAASERSQADAEAAMRAALTDQAMAAAGIPPAQREAMIAQVLDPWFRWFLRYDPAPVLARIRVPVLALNGSLDRQVLPAANLAGIRAATAGNRDVTLIELPGLNHLFQTARTGGLGEYAEIEETMAPVALETVSAWIRARFPRR
jgi:pimeloyl-ACP methyl ester carboxylesterase